MSDVEDRSPEDPERVAASEPSAPPEPPPAPPEAPSAPFEPAAAPAGLPPASAGWTSLPPVRADDPAENHGWPTPTPLPDGDPIGFEPPSAPPALPPPLLALEPPPPDRRPVRHSRNPVDRLTRGLPNPLRVTIDWVVTIVGAIVIVLLVKAFVVNPYRIPSSSMEPTLHCARSEPGCEARYSDRVLANRFLYRLRDPRRGEIVVFKTPAAAKIKCGAGGTFVKRLIGLPGDTLQVKLRNGNGYVYINGKPLKEPYIQQSRRAAVQGFGPVKVAPGHYFMMGDNRSQSCDSRMWGTVPRANLIGKVFATYWPPNRISLH